MQQQEMTRFRVNDPLFNAALFTGGLGLETFKKSLQSFRYNEPFMGGFGFTPVQENAEIGFYQINMYPISKVEDFCKTFADHDPRPVQFQSKDLQLSEEHGPLYYFVKDGELGKDGRKTMQFHCISLPKGLAPAVNSYEKIGCH